ncbi:MAG: cbb3-type cytochrome c oxidase subunit I [Armatimonadota bacterium]|nr:cbb3-type cytochrome c oxidase subunit I [Armatimonadota bacterium]
MTVPLDSLPSTVRVVEVGPRDGLQNEPEILPTDVKVAFIEALAEAGLRWIEVGSFVRPDRVPQMADTEEVVHRLRPREGVHHIALVPNLRGLQRAVACGVRTIAVFTAATDAFAQANLGMTVEASLRTFREVVREAHREGMSVRGYISVAWWCPYSGRADPRTVRRIALELLEMGCEDVSVADTVGAVLAVATLLVGALVFVPALPWSAGLLAHLDPFLWKLVYWGFAHPSQQINLAATVAVWYLLAQLTVGGRTPSEKVSRAAFVLYLVAINLGSAHHLQTEPSGALSVGWKWINRRVVGERWARWQPWLFGVGVGLLVLAYLQLGVRYGLPRKQPDIFRFRGLPLAFAWPDEVYRLLAVAGVGGILALLGGAPFVVLVVATVLLGKRLTDDELRRQYALPLGGNPGHGAREVPAVPGTFVLCLLFAAFFVFMYLGNYWNLSRSWPIGH